MKMETPRKSEPTPKKSETPKQQMSTPTTEKVEPTPQKTPTSERKSSFTPKVASPVKVWLTVYSQKKQSILKITEVPVATPEGTPTEETAKPLKGQPTPKKVIKWIED